MSMMKQKNKSMRYPVRSYPLVIRSHYEMNGQKHAYMNSVCFIYINLEDQMICSIARKFQLFKKSYELINGYSVDGNIFSLHFTVVDPNGPSKERQSRLRNSMKLKSLRRNKNYLHLPF